MQLDGILSGLNPKHKVFILGSAVVDLVLSVNRLPKSGEDISAVFQGGKVGGCAFNVADVLTKLDLPCSTYFPVGEGMFAQIVKQEFIKRSIAISQVCNCGDNGWNLSLVEPDGERTFITMSGLECRMQKQWFDKYSFSDFDYFYLSGYQAEGENGDIMLEILKRKRKDSFLIFDPGPRSEFISAEKMHCFEELNCIYTINAKEACILSGRDYPDDAALELCKRTGNPAVITDGAKGAYLACDNKVSLIPGVSIKVADTIGSGDAHTGGFIAGLMCDLSLEDAVKLANYTAAYVTAHQGAACAPTADQMLSFFTETL